jgi:hypothetical protein
MVCFVVRPSKWRRQLKISGLLTGAVTLVVAPPSSRGVPRVHMQAVFALAWISTERESADAESVRGFI